MHPADADEPLVLSQFRSFLDEALPMQLAAWGGRADFPARVAWQRRLAAQRWVGLSWPEEHGGRGLTIQQRLACDIEAARRGCLPIAGIMGVNNVAPAVIAFGTAQQQRHLPAIQAAQEIWCQGFSEPEAGSDLAGLRTTARPVEGGFEVTGRKIWTSSGMDATHCMVLVRTDSAKPKHRGISVLLTSMDVDGIERRPIKQMDGRSDFAELSFDQVFVACSGLLGSLDDGWRIITTTLAQERAAVISQAATLEHAIEAEIDRVRGTDDDQLRDELAQRFIEGRVLNLLGSHMLARLGPGDAPGPEQAMIRLVQSELRQQLALTRAKVAGTDLIDGRAADVAAELLASRSVSIAAGTREVLKTVLAESVLGMPRG
ncbi:acyl-CoA dehydrogenase family protein [Mycobacterium marseillense]|uniref:acyl-CoA dehydrogenase family protein n=1 Tax=Mycobacterium marseillense TaxID=701042 RepID=UPI0015D1C9C7|nr:acyl-CoA dehydrogenase family protein [Mycobacterium marseillense]